LRVLGKIRDWLSRRRAINMAEISDFGIKVMADEKLKERLQIIIDLYIKTEKKKLDMEVALHDKVDKLRSRLIEINAALKLASIPYGRAGEKGAYAQMCLGWEQLYHRSLEIIDIVDATLETVDVDQNELVRKLESFLNIEVYPYGMLIMDVSYYEKDVREAHAVVIQTPPTPPTSPIPVTYEPDEKVVNA